jgi:hypothetical protein
MRTSAFFRLLVRILLAAIVVNQPALVAQQGDAPRLPARSLFEPLRPPAGTNGSRAVTLNSSASATSTAIAVEGLAAGMARRTAPTLATRTKAPIVGRKLGDQALTFVENQGQWDDSVRFQLRSGAKTLWLTKTGVVFDALRANSDQDHATQRSAAPTALSPTDRTGYQRLVFSEEFVGARSSPTVEAAALRLGRYNYLGGGDSTKWRTDAQGYGSVIYRNVWDGIDVRVLGRGKNIEQEFVIQPKAALSQVQVNYRGIDKLTLAKDGSLLIHTAFGELRESKPTLYQEIAGSRVPVEGRFKLTGKTSYAFEATSYRSEYALVVDPTLLYSTYLGGGATDEGNAIAVDAAGSAYVTGITCSSNFPTTPSSLGIPPSTCWTSFVTKLSPFGDSLEYSTYLGSQARAYAIAVNSAGEAYVAGGNAISSSYGYPYSFPTTSNAFQTGCYDSTFLTKLNAQGSDILYSTCLGVGLGGIYGQGAHGLALDQTGRAYITGSAGAGIPTTAGAFQGQVAFHNASNAFVTIFDPSASGGASLVYSTYLGGDNGAVFQLFDYVEGGAAVAVDSAGMIYITGTTRSFNFPVTPGAFLTSLPGRSCYPQRNDRCPSGFIAKLDPTAWGPSSLIYSTFLGGAPGAVPSAISIDSVGNAYVTGLTGLWFTNPGPAFPFPTTPGAYQTNPLASGVNTFVTKLNSAGNGLIYSTFLGPGGPDYGTGIAVDISGDAYVTGYTESPNFPTTSDAFQAASPNSRFFQGFITKFNDIGSALLYSSYLGGATRDTTATGISVDTIGDAYVVGTTGATDFPVSTLAFQHVFGGGVGDAFVSKFPLGSLGLSTDHGGNTGDVTLTISGSGILSGSSAKLVCSGQEILAVNNTISPDTKSLTAMFDLAGAVVGQCTVVVTRPDGNMITVRQQFTIEQGGAPQVWVDIISRPTFRPGTEQTIYLLYGNTGNTDAFGVPVTATIPLGVAVNLKFTLTPPPSVLGVTPPNWSQVSPVVQTPTSQLIPLFLPVIPAGQTGSLAIGLTVPPGTPGHTPINLGVSANAPYFSSLSNPVQAFSQSANCALSLAGTAMNVLGIFLPTSCALGAALAAQNIYFTFIQNATQGNVATVGSGLQLLWSVVMALANCASYAIGFQAAIQAASAAYSLYQTVLACAPIAQRLLQAQAVTAGDPNFLIGPSGAGSSKWTAAGVPLHYLIGFENEADASAPAQRVVVINPIDENSDLDTLQLIAINLMGIEVPLSVPLSPGTGVNRFTGLLDLRPNQNLLVTIDVKLNTATRLLTWTFTSIDPSTGEPPVDVLAGFLLPGGQGTLVFSVKAKHGVFTGTEIRDQASVVFDALAPIPTAVWVNTIDGLSPVSSVSALPTTEETTFTLQWAGSDVGSDIQDFSVFVSDNSGPFIAFQTNTVATSAMFTGQTGHSYAFYSIARDLVGNVEGAKTAAEATTQVVTGDTTPPVIFPNISGTLGNNGWYMSNVTVSWNASDPESGIAASSGCNPTTLTADTAGVTLTCGATNGVGLTSSMPVTIKIDKTPPSITGARTPGPNANGWNNTPVTVSFQCSDGLSGLAPGSPRPPTVLSAEGTGQFVTGTCQDLAGNTASATVGALNIDLTPPTVTCVASPSGLWPPNNLLVPISVAVNVTDALSGPGGFSLLSATSSEPDSGAGDIQGFAIASASTTGLLRAQRLDSGHGRVYTLGYTGSDRAGNTASCKTTVTVPHDQGK